MDPFHKGCFIHIGRGNCPLCAICSLMAYLSIRGNMAGPLLFSFKMVDLSLEPPLLTGYVGSCPWLAFKVHSKATASALGQQLYSVVPWLLCSQWFRHLSEFKCDVPVQTSSAVSFQSILVSQDTF